MNDHEPAELPLWVKAIAKRANAAYDSPRHMTHGGGSSPSFGRTSQKANEASQLGEGRLTLFADR